jgi:hypothetical protein
MTAAASGPEAATFLGQVIEGRVRVAPGPPVHESVFLTLPPGTFREVTDQDLGDLPVVRLSVHRDRRHRLYPILREEYA